MIYLKKIRISASLLLLAVLLNAVPCAIINAQFQQGNCSLYITSRPSGADIYIDGIPSDRQTPVMLTGLAPGKRLIRLERGEYVAEKEVILEEGIFTRHELILHLGRVKIEIHSQPDSVMVIVGSREVGSTPILVEINDPGAYNLRFFKEHYMPKDTVIHFPERITYQVSVALERSAVLQIDSDPPGADVFLDREIRGNTPLKTEVSAGEHGLQLMLGDYQIYQRIITLQPGDTIQISAELEKLKGRLTVKGVPDNASIYLDGAFFGYAPIESVPLDVGEYEVTYYKPGYIPLEEPVKAWVVQDLETVVELKAKRKTALSGVIRSALFPGMGQLYVERKLKGYTYTASEIGLLTAATASIILYNQAVNNYNSAREEYLQQIKEDEIIRTRNNMNDRYDEVEKYKLMRDAFTALAAGFWVWNIVDVYIWNEPPKQRSSPIYGTLESRNGSLSFKITWEF